MKPSPRGAQPITASALDTWDGESTAQNAPPRAHWTLEGESVQGNALLVPVAFLVWCLLVCSAEREGLEAEPGWD